MESATEEVAEMGLLVVVITDARFLLLLHELQGDLQDARAKEVKSRSLGAQCRYLGATTLDQQLPI